MSLEKPHCPICLNDRAIISSNGGSFRVKCWCCGDFAIGIRANAVLAGESSNEVRSRIIYALSNGFENKITLENLETIKRQKLPQFHEIANRLLQVLADRFPIPGTEIKVLEPGMLNGVDISEYPGVSIWSHEEKSVTLLKLKGLVGAFDFEELDFILGDYLEDEMEFIEKEGFDLKITPKGWRHIEELNSGKIESNFGFVAMSFAPEWSELYKNSIEPGIRNAGYDPIRVDRQEHNNNITDEIIALIRRSKFIVADFSAGNQGAYYEAGFARGLGREVISLCRKDLLEKLHFDTKQINHIRWEDGKWDDLKRAITNRIEATIGRGSF